MLALLSHYFIPRSSNNHRARFIHPTMVGFVVLTFIALQLLLTFLPQFTPVVWGYSSNITPEEIIALTNKERVKMGVPEVSMDPLLTQAALSKAADMFARNYWAHNAPDGTEPWKFVVDADYKYRYAGENLARDFDNSQAVVTAWMNSPSHKENLLSSRYQDIGVAVVQGELKGVQTTLVVQFFGTKMGLAINSNSESVKKIVPAFKEASVAGIVGENNSRTDKYKLFLSPFGSTRKIALFAVSLFVLIFILDLVIVKQKNVQRVSSRSFAHLFFLVMVLVVLFASRSGIIL